MKICSVCEVAKSLGDFNLQPRNKDGLDYRCKECQSEYNRQYRQKNRERLRKLDGERWREDPARRIAHKEASKRYCDNNADKIRQYAQTEQGKKVRQRSVKAYVERYPHKKKAQQVVMIEVRAGRLKKQPCEVCGAVIAEAHHDDYSKPLEIRWMCRKHHREHHTRKES